MAAQDATAEQPLPRNLPARKARRAKDKRQEITLIARTAQSAITNARISRATPSSSRSYSPSGACRTRSCSRSVLTPRGGAV